MAPASLAGNRRFFEEKGLNMNLVTKIRAGGIRWNHNQTR